MRQRRIIPMKNHLLKRLRYLWTFELFNAVVMFPLLLWAMRRRLDIGLFSLFTTGLVCLILLVGAAFWYLKYRDVQRTTRRLPRSRPFFRLAKRALAGLLLAVPVVLAWRWDDLGRGDMLFGLGMGLLALLEYVNYFYVQLMYDNQAELRYLLAHRRLKRAALVRELDL